MSDIAIGETELARSPNKADAPQGTPDLPAPKGRHGPGTAGRDDRHLVHRHRPPRDRRDLLLRGPGLRPAGGGAAGRRTGTFAAVGGTRLAARSRSCTAAPAIGPRAVPEPVTPTATAARVARRGRRRPDPATDAWTTGGGSEVTAPGFRTDGTRTRACHGLHHRHRAPSTAGRRARSKERRACGGGRRAAGPTASGRPAPPRGKPKGPGGSDEPPGPFASFRYYSGCRLGRHTTSALVCWTSWYGTRSRR
jgi:hypothetical protein